MVKYFVVTDRIDSPTFAEVLPLNLVIKKVGFSES
jgi:hypothetical protein